MSITVNNVTFRKDLKRENRFRVSSKGKDGLSKNILLSIKDGSTYLNNHTIEALQIGKPKTDQWVDDRLDINEYNKKIIHKDETFRQATTKFVNVIKQAFPNYEIGDVVISKPEYDTYLNYSYLSKNNEFEFNTGVKLVDSKANVISGDFVLRVDSIVIRNDCKNDKPKLFISLVIHKVLVKGTIAHSNIPDEADNNIFD